jgi:sugar lactone lactonase YvrE
LHAADVKQFSPEITGNILPARAVFFSCAFARFEATWVGIVCFCRAPVRALYPLASKTFRWASWEAYSLCMSAPGIKTMPILHHAGSATVELLLDAHATLGEGPAWHAEMQRLYWVVILGQALHCYQPATPTDQQWPLPAKIGCVAPRKTGGYLLGMAHGLAFFEPTSGAYELIRPIPGCGDVIRVNDGKCDPVGRLWVGTMDDQSQTRPLGALYCLEPDLTLRTIATHITISNGLTWNPEYTVMYYIDTPTRQIVAYDYDVDTGTLARKRVVLTIPVEMGWPDGMTADQEGMLWVAHWGGWQVARWNPANGQLLASYAVPVERTSACCFGGPDYRDLYITTARTGGAADVVTEQSAAGGLFRLRTEVEGLPTWSFAG